MAFKNKNHSNATMPEKDKNLILGECKNGKNTHMLFYGGNIH